MKLLSSCSLELWVLSPEWFRRPESHSSHETCVLKQKLLEWGKVDFQPHPCLTHIENTISTASVLFVNVVFVLNMLEHCLLAKLHLCRRKLLLLENNQQQWKASALYCKEFATKQQLQSSVQQWLVSGVAPVTYTKKHHLWVWSYTSTFCPTETKAHSMLLYTDLL